MLYTIAALLIAVWLIGLILSVPGHGYINVLLILAAALVIADYWQKRKA